MKTQKPNNTTTTTTTGKLPVAPSLEIVVAAVRMADISGFSSLSEKLRNEFGDTEGNVGLNLFLDPNTAAIDTYYLFILLLCSVIN